MKLKILLVEDEPAALKILENIVSNLSMELIIVGKARNGIEACKIIDENQRIDVVITDIKMPLMDGLELSKYIKERKKGIDVVILSGFQEFTFAQKAIEFGVEEYLLKPLMPEKIEQVLLKLQVKNLEENQEITKYFLEKQLKSIPSENLLIEKVERYKLLLLQVGSVNGQSSVKNINSSELESLMKKRAAYVLEGNNKNQVVIAIPTKENLETVLDDICSLELGNLMTIIYSDKEWEIKNFHATFHNMERLMRNVHKMNERTIINFDTSNERIFQVVEKNEWENLIKKLNDQLLHGEWSELEKTLLHYLNEEKVLADLTTISIVKRVQRVIQFMNAQLNNKNQLHTSIIDDIIFSSIQLEDVSNGFVELIQHFIKRSKQFPDKVDSYEFFELVSNFVQKYFSEPDLNLSLISEHFGISITSINELFKKFQKQTFKEFLVALRMEQAKKMIQEQPQKNLKQISEEVGYNDALYFSKVFKKKFGESPSNFQKSIRTQ